jgi:hypothetical protein
VILGAAACVFIAVFVANSLVQFYWRYRSYGDVIIEVLIGACFSLFMVQMLVMALGGARP